MTDKKITVELLKDLAKQGKVPSVITYDIDVKGEYSLFCKDICVTNFHLGDKITIVWKREYSTPAIVHVPELKNYFEEAYEGYCLVLDEILHSDEEKYIILTIKKSNIEDLMISDDYKLVMEKMNEVKEVHKLVEETKDIQKVSAGRINSLFSKVKEIKEYGDSLKLNQTNQEQYNKKLDEFNQDVQELEIRLKKDIPELDKNLNINNFR